MKLSFKLLVYSLAIDLYRTNSQFCALEAIFNKKNMFVVEKFIDRYLINRNHSAYIEGIHGIHHPLVAKY